MDKPFDQKQHHAMGQSRLINLQHFRRILICCAALILGLMGGGCGLDETLHRSDKPLSLQSAKKDIWISSLPFPNSTRDIYYLYHAGGMQEYQFLVRFTVATNDLDTAVSAFLSDHDKTTREQHSYKTSGLSEAPSPPSFAEFSAMPWWNPGSITNGYYRASTEGQPFQIWVDRSKQTVYLCETD